jgi:MoaA/NifB/PqqE/SkfB family radical SAM enzyme
MNPVSQLATWGDYFRDPIHGVGGQPGTAKPDVHRPSKPCRIGHTHLYLAANGDVHLCWEYPPIGNIKRDSIPELWYSDKAEELRDRIARCNQPCTVSCLLDRGLKDTVTAFVKLVRPNKG